jgi:hypothetical protein
MPSKRWLSEIAPMLIAAFFLVVPALVILAVAGRQGVPEDDYAQAVREAMQPDAKYVSRSLEPMPTDAVTLVAWTQRDSVHYFKESSTLGKDVWVAVASKVKGFCQEFVRSHGKDEKRLTLRLEQRLGLPPNSGHESFVEFKVEGKDVSKIFRPCVYVPASSTCEPVEALQTIDAITKDFKSLDSASDKGFDKYWVLNNYYRSFETSRPYPWTSLGYTFDWARNEDGGGDFVRWGESEFVIPEGTTIQFGSATDTMPYCAVQ